MSITHSYTVDLNWEDGRKGLLSIPGVPPEITVVTPPPFPNGIDNHWSPEHLLVAAVNSCLMTTFLAIAENSRLQFTNFKSSATGKLEMAEGKYMITELTLAPVLEIPGESDRAKAERILQKSEAACLISNSVKSKIIFVPRINITPIAVL
jgi:organic hydroperoxide reductase OsmC/OhrA